uniref:Uncharacterized protein n=1 Tax=Heterorhabditis bacteriophora TaxID=37862 RepID=A0A1I7XIS5_HETBA
MRTLQREKGTNDSKDPLMTPQQNRKTGIIKEYKYEDVPVLSTRLSVTKSKMIKDFLLPLVFAGIIAVMNAQFYTERSGYAKPYGEYGGYNRGGYDFYRTGLGSGYPSQHSQNNYHGGYSPQGYYNGPYSRSVYPSNAHFIGRYPVGGHYGGGYPTTYLE